VPVIYIRELLGTPNKLAEHVSQNQGYLAPGIPGPLRATLSESVFILLLLPPPFSRPFTAFLLSSLLSVLLFLFFSTYTYIPPFSLSLLPLLSPYCFVTIHVVFHAERRGWILFQRELALVCIFLHSTATRVKFRGFYFCSRTHPSRALPLSNSSHCIIAGSRSEHLPRCQSIRISIDNCMWKE